MIGVPKTIDGDLKNDAVAVSFGFDTACKARPVLERCALSAAGLFETGWCRALWLIVGEVLRDDWL